MKSEAKILGAFILNLIFSLFEFFGAAFTGSVAIMSDAVHDLGDALSIGISFILERKSKRNPDLKYTYGYARYSLLGCALTSLILLLGSSVVIYNAAIRLMNPEPINYNGMVVFAIIGVIVNFIAVFFTRGGGSLNQKAVNLHLLEDVLGWVIVLIGAIIMKFTSIRFLDPLMSIGLGVFIIINAAKNLHEVLNIFLEKAPSDLDLNGLYSLLCQVDGVIDVHHVHIRSFDGVSNCATLHVVTDGDGKAIKESIRTILNKNGIEHTTIEIEAGDEVCLHKSCSLQFKDDETHKHHHH